MSSSKSARVAARRRERNAPLRSEAKTYVAQTRHFIADNDIEAAESVAKNATVALDKAAQKGAIHPRNAARRKSRLMKQLHRAKNA